MPIIMPDGAQLWDDSNAHELIGVQGVGYGCLPRSTHPRFSSYGSVPAMVRFEDSGIKRIPRSEWPERIEDAWAKKAFPLHAIRPPFTARSQGRTNYCWANGPCSALDIVRRMAGLPFNEASAASVACPVVNYRNIGNWGIDAIQYMVKTGPCSSDLWPNAAIDRRYDTAKSRADRENHKIVQWIDIPSRDIEAVVSCILPPAKLPCAVGYDWWGHEVCAVAVKWVSGKLVGVIFNSWENAGWGYRNEYGVRGFGDLAESQFTPDDVQAVRMATISPGV